MRYQLYLIIFFKKLDFHSLCLGFHKITSLGNDELVKFTPFSQHCLVKSQLTAVASSHF